MPKKVSLEELEEGSVLASPVLNSFGQTLVGAGATLTAKHLNVLKTWGVHQVNIKTEDDSDIEGASKISDEVKKVAEEQFNKRLKWKPSNKFEWEIYNIGLMNAASKIK